MTNPAAYDIIKLYDYEYAHLCFREMLGEEGTGMDNLVSIIVPIYNVRQYLERCVLSLVNQTYPNLEIILVDDGSTDGSGLLCDAWQEKDARIQAFHKPNGGLSDARNYGMEKATGAYVCFIDSDDWIAPNFVKVMLGAVLDTDCDIAECDYLCTDGEETQKDNDNCDCEIKVFAGNACFLRFLTNDFFVSVWNKLYRAEVLENQPFRKGVYHEDEFWTYQIFSKARRVCRLNYTGYYYYQRQGSIVHTKPSEKRITDAFTAGKERVDFIEEHYKEFAPVGYSKMMYTCMYLFNEVRNSDIPQKPELQRELASYFHVIFRKYLRTRKYQKEMWRFCVFRLFPNWYCRLNY